jgi:hypothetical protein
MIAALLAAGADAFRVNMSHGTQPEKAALIAAIRAVEAAHNRPLTILADLQGPKLRVGRFAGGAAQLGNAEPGGSEEAGRIFAPRMRRCHHQRPATVAITADAEPRTERIVHRSTLGEAAGPRQSRPRRAHFRRDCHPMFTALATRCPSH